jgi:N-acetyl-1-D-myo-inositol-2-amino-2-deoxy-alpha-D-glucopyranoside deacetylase
VAPYNPAMRTLLAVHAHPDDECLLTGGILARTAAEGGRTVLVTCTDGAVGEIADPALATPENLVEVRSRELDESVRILGISRLEKLGYRDSGMAGTADNEHPQSFRQADFEAAVGKVVRVIRQERPQVIVTYDENGGYGHPDHVRAHQVAVIAFDAAGHSARFPDAGPAWAPSRLFFAVLPHSSFRRFGEMIREAGIEAPFPDLAEGQVPPFGVSDERVTTRIDVSGYVEAKRASILAHQTQLGGMQFLTDLPAKLFDEMFARETFQLVRGPRAGADSDLFGGLD